MKKLKLLLLILGVMVLSLAPASTSQAKVSSSTVRSIYKKFLKKEQLTVKTKTGYSYTFSMKSFLLLDVDRDKVPELFIKNVDADRAMGTVRVYSIKKNKIYFCGEYGTKAMNSVSYCPKYKGFLFTWWTNGVGGNGSLLYGISLKKHELPEKYKAWSGADRMGADAKIIYKTGKKLSLTTKKKYDSYMKKYFSPKKYETHTFLANTAKNRKKLKW